MKKKKNILRGAGVLLIGALLICSSVATIAITDKKTDFSNISNNIETNMINIGIQFLQENPILWDNFVLEVTVGYHAQDDPPEVTFQWDSFPADDFKFEEDTEVHWVYWQLVYWNCNMADGPKDYHYNWNITFFEDDGSGYRPGDIFAGPFTIDDGDIVKSVPFYNSSSDAGGIWNCGAVAYLPSPVTFNADTKYWISIYSTGPHYPQTGWYGHNESIGGIRLHEAIWRSNHFGYPYWTNFTDIYGEPLDMNFILGGDPQFEIILDKGIGVTATITNMLPEPYNTTNVTATFTVTGGFVLNRRKTIEIGNLDPGETGIAKFIPIGLGRITVEVFVYAESSGSAWKDTKAFLLIIFTG